VFSDGRNAVFPEGYAEFDTKLEKSDIKGYLEYAHQEYYQYTCSKAEA
jgi:hypothetical protein